MYAVYAVLPVLVIGVIAWGIVAVIRQRGREPFTLATAAAWYGHVTILGSAVMALLGVGLALTSVLGRISLDWSYYVPPYDGAVGDLARHRDQDLVLGLTLLGVGVAVLAVHATVVRLVRGLPGGAPGWVTRGNLVMFAAFTGLVSVISATGALYQLLTMWTGSADGTQQFGDSAAIAVAFLPAWIVSVVSVLRLTRRGQAPAPAAPTAQAVTGVAG